MKETTMKLPEKYKDLEPFTEWALPTPNGRQQKRLATSPEELKVFYTAMLPHIKDILKICDKHALGELPEELQPVFNMMLSVAEIAHHIELYRGQTGVPYAFEESRFVATHGEHETWKAAPPSGLVR